MAKIKQKEYYRSLLPCRAVNAHKGNCGEVFIIAGSPGMSGAAILCAKGALRSGAGLVKIAAPKSISGLIDIAVTESITYGLAENIRGLISDRTVPQILELAGKSDVIAIGPGLSFSSILEKITGWNKPIVIDADGLNSISENPNILMRFKSSAVITPHPGELSRLLAVSIDAILADRVAAAKNAAKKWGVICVLKGAGTVVATPDGKFYVNTTGNSGMASGGMGDVLTGIIASFIAQGTSPYEAAILGVYLHGLAGDLAVKQKGIHGLIATDVAEAVPEAILQCLKK
ncbi:NAD(P)H-hydrate dehydratase [candidate division WOR-1 bacterium RIFOXYA12_FULL_43_27]|uniref:ADP-dependent (S)-NAD(P)H-hydrate dehydratase n=1 Tax=candidate division WOR-1 bacterium RIFOXYC2_FULL_46_14 TaxID=1802587 RepID=A0A1F4U894_UNCSA|nr:MAG: NAD(P)H-hydrate dehydratase [candidate division WOR-1 bacterium RIFOXYA12_FULL_43_27]OGC20047.1 MAG: NAD(P)H-hydrate dehydratase [candidate division WOR-1 bacterium RIFOXYB2_FULL_46_45]OGC32217.1 MAG: NAD(P)H-hydrate dehydratase [candidate division WOR-1 bacterium RIFOXYA2_FULL_46_56]OGC41121.1 MAG: NAD(P)H-hydrate dehydratase [candidate division WOR-1 bacterium RIFOXYC2_FULL_46_14]